MATEVLSGIKADGDWTGIDTSAYGARLYTTIQSWEAALGGTSGDLVAEDTIAVAEIYGNLDIAGGLWTNGWTHDATHYCKIRAAVGHEIDPKTRTGATFSLSSGGYYFVTYANHIIYVENLGITVDPVKSNNSLEHTWNDVTVFNNCVFWDVNNSIFNGAIVNSCLFIVDRFTSTTNSGGNPRGGRLNNCTIIVKAGFGAWSGDCGAWWQHITNCVVYNENTKTTYPIYYQPGSLTTCAQNNNGSAALGVGHVDGITTADFTDYANGDYSVATGSALIDAGTDLSAEFTTDIVGTVRG